MPRYELLAVDRAESFCDALDKEVRIGVDTEFMREKTYYARLCLVQVAAGNALYCIDPLAAAAPASFWSALMTPTWIVHSGRQDLEVVYQAAGRLPRGLFDTQVAAALLGHAPQLGYANLVAELFDVQLAKSQTRADWSRRPLPPAALEYAAEDVEHLLPAAQLLHEQLDAAGRLDWAREDSADLLEPALYESDALNAVERVKGARNLRGRARRAAVGLARWREEQAERSDKPRQWILRDAALLQIATSGARSLRDLTDIRDLPAATARRAGSELLDILASAAGGSDDYEPPGRPDEAQKALMKVLQAKVQACARDLGIAAEVLAPRKELAAAIGGQRDLRVFRGWRRRLLGDELLDPIS